jgi:protein MAK16
MRKLALKTREKVMTMPRRDIKREARREKKAETAALLEKNIEKELLERLKQGVYGDIYNYPQEQFESIIKKEESIMEKEVEEEEEEEPEIEFVESYESEEEDIEDFGFQPIDMDDDEDFEDDEDVPEARFASRKLKKDGARGKSKKKPAVEIEDEYEDDERQTLVH